MKFKSNQSREKIFSGQKLGMHGAFALHFFFIVKTKNESNHLIISSLSFVSDVKYEKLLRRTKVSKRKKENFEEYEHTMSANSRRAGFSRIMQEIE